MDKFFDKWNEIKKFTSKIEQKYTYKTREIYWIKMGQNLGYEIYGKGEEFLRPVLIFRKFGKDSFLGIPLTSAAKEDMFHFKFLPVNKEKINYAILSQIRFFSVKRFKSKFGKISSDDFLKLKQKLKILLELEDMPL